MKAKVNSHTGDYRLAVKKSKAEKGPNNPKHPLERLLHLDKDYKENPMSSRSSSPDPEMCVGVQRSRRTSSGRSSPGSSWRTGALWSTTTSRRSRPCTSCSACAVASSSPPPVPCLQVQPDPKVTWCLTVLERTNPGNGTMFLVLGSPQRCFLL